MVKKEQPILGAALVFIKKHCLFCLKTNDLDDLIIQVLHWLEICV